MSEFLVGLFEVSDTDKASAGTMTAREILDRGAEKLTGPELADQPLLQARLMDTVGSVFRKLGLYEEATVLLERALEIRSRHLGEEHIDVAASLHNLGNLFWSRGDLLEARSRYEQALAIRDEGPAAPG